AGTITEFTGGRNPGSVPFRIATGPDGNLWFGDTGALRAIGQFGVGAPAASIAPPAIAGSGLWGRPQSCGGDQWSTWAGQQPSHDATTDDGYRWLRDGTAIPGAVGQSYTPTTADVGHQLTCAATVTYPLFVATVSSPSAPVTGHF